MDEYEAENAAVEEARNELGFDEDRFRAAFQAGYAAGRDAGYAEGWDAGIKTGIEAVNKQLG